MSNKKRDFLLIINLEQYGTTREVWSYLNLEDIKNLMSASKDTKEFCLRINKTISFNIMIPFFLKNINDLQKNDILRNNLKSFPNISKLKIVDPMGITIAIMKVIYCNNNLCQTLQDLTVTFDGDGAMKGMSNLINLTKLNLTGSNISEEGIKELFKMSKLKELNISFCFEIQDFKFLSFSSISLLTYLTNNGRIISDIGMINICSLTNLLNLNISRSASSDLGYSNISKLVKLTNLDLSSSSITDNGLSYLYYLTNLTSLLLCFCHNITNNGISQLYRNL